MKIRVDEIQVKEGRRELDGNHVRELADSIRELGLLNPITVDKDHFLIAGLHRLEAVKLLEWPEVECTVSSLEGLRAELAEIDENIVRNDFSAIEYGEMLLRRKEIYETLHPETKATYDGGQFKGNQHKNVVTDKVTATTKSFVQDTAEKLGVGPRTVERQIQTAKNLTPEAKEIIRDTDMKVTKKAALKLSRLEPEQQKEAAALLAAKEIKTVDEYTTAKAAEPAPEPVEQKKNAPEPIQPEETKQEPDKPVPVSSVPYSLPEGGYTTIKESVAALKNPDIDCSCTPDSFLAEFTAFVRKYLREIEWYSSPYYEAAYPSISPEQLDYLRQQMDSVQSANVNLINQIERKMEK